MMGKRKRIIMLSAICRNEKCRCCCDLRVDIDAEKIPKTIKCPGCGQTLSLHDPTDFMKCESPRNEHVEKSNELIYLKELIDTAKTEMELATNNKEAKTFHRGGLKYLTALQDRLVAKCLTSEYIKMLKK